MPFFVPAEDNTFHVVSKDALRNPHIQECMNHSDKQAFLPGVREELNITLSTAMTDHGKTCDSVCFPCFRLYRYKPPIHLVAFSGLCPIASSPVTLRSYNLTFWGNKVLVFTDIILYGRKAALVTCFFHSVKTDRRISDSFGKQGVDDACKAGQDGMIRPASAQGMWFIDKPIFLDPA